MKQPAPLPRSARTTPAPSATAVKTTREPGPPGEQASCIAELLPAARGALDELHRDGRRLTRDALAAQLRDNGHPVRNSRLTPLLQALRSETATSAPSRPTGKAA